MRKYITVILVIIACAAVSVITYRVGRTSGIRHAIEDSEIFTVECCSPEFEREDRDYTIWIDLDGELYEHGIIQG